MYMYICFSVGGSQPIVFSYVSEFFTEKQKGPVIIILASCWQPGIIFTGTNVTIIIYYVSVHALCAVYTCTCTCTCVIISFGITAECLSTRLLILRLYMYTVHVRVCP